MCQHRSTHQVTYNDDFDTKLHIYENTRIYKLTCQSNMEENDHFINKIILTEPCISRMHGLQSTCLSCINLSDVSASCRLWTSDLPFHKGNIGLRRPSGARASPCFRPSSFRYLTFELGPSFCCFQFCLSGPFAVVLPRICLSYFYCIFVWR